MKAKIPPDYGRYVDVMTAAGAQPLPYHEWLKSVR